MTDPATSANSMASTDDAAKLTKIRALLATPDADPGDLLAAIGRIIAHERPAPADVYQKPWG